MIIKFSEGVENVFYTQCGAPIEKNSKFCTSCGTRLVQKEVNGTNASPPRGILAEGELNQDMIVTADLDLEL
jgi:hypothetical protein